jgi:hypothetical protein
MTDDRERPHTVVASRGWMGRYGGEMLLLVAIGAAAAVFGLQRMRGGDDVKPASREEVYDTSEVKLDSSTSSQQAPADAPPVSIPSKGKSPSRPLFRALPFSAEDRDRQLKICMARAQSAPTYPGGGTGAAQLLNMGLVGDTLVFDGSARNLTTGRKLVWRCGIADWDGRVGGMNFTTLEGIDGVDLEWGKIAAIDDEILRRCVVQAQSLYPGRKIPPYPLGGRRSDVFALDGVALGENGVQGTWRCDIRLEKGKISYLLVTRPPPAPSPSAPDSTPSPTIPDSTS